jgi:putative membrane protein
MKKEKNNKLSIYAKGFLMGACDIIPGVSGGTVAFITGIYMDFICSVKNINYKNIKKLVVLLWQRKWSSFWLEMKVLKFDFLLILLLGILSAIFLVSRVVLFLLEDYRVFTLSFFVGLILASAKVVLKEINLKSFQNILFGILGLTVGIGLNFLVPLNIDTPSLFYLFISGFLAISAMFLPGISGSFILLILGVYQFILNALHHISSSYFSLSVFILGILFGAFFISRFINLVYHKDKSKTLFVLLGLVIGSLSIPVFEIIKLSSGFGGLNILLEITLFLLGFVLVFGLSKASVHK